MTIAVALILLGIPIATGIVERWDGSGKEINRMADRDRAKQRTVLPQRRMQYMRVYQPKIKPLRGRAAG